MDAATNNLSPTKKRILGNVISNLRDISKVMFLRYILINTRNRQVLLMTMVLPTLSENKVGNRLRKTSKLYIALVAVLLFFNEN